MKTKEEKSKICAFAACILIVLGSIPYLWKNLTGAIHPNASSWLIFAFIGVLNATSYKKLTGDWVKSVFPTVNTLILLLTTALVLRKGSFGNLGAVDVCCLIFGILAALVWWIFKKKESAPALVQVILEIGAFIGFIPTILATAHDPSREFWLAWFLWSCSFYLQFLTVKYTWKGNWVDFLFPLNRMALNGIVFVLALR